MKATKTEADKNYIIPTENGFTICLPARLDPNSTSPIWQSIQQQLQTNNTPSIRVCIDASNVSYCDTCGIAMLLETKAAAKTLGGTCEIRDLDPKFEQLFKLFSNELFKTEPQHPHHRCCMPEELGEATLRILRELHTFVSFTGELSVNLFHMIRHPRAFRWGETAKIIEKAGVNGFPIVALIGFLLGLILAFQSAIPMNMFGAGIYVANLVSLSLVRELGPLITAIIFAGRSGSSFAAELGTMKVNDELNALKTMGLNPLSFLAVPRIAASLFVVPLLSAFATIFGIIGAAPVVMSLGYPMVTYVDRVSSSIDIGDILGGLFKAMVFGLLISAVGCHQGLQTKAGAQAVGESTTRSVVQSIVFIAVADGLFAVVFYYLGI